MGTIVRTFNDGSYLEYDKGAFDSWCVYLSRPSKSRFAPKDIQYFEILEKVGAKYGYEQLYDDFIVIYELTKKKIEDSVFSKIDELCVKYGQDALIVSIVFSIIYMGMVAEENKQNTKLGKRIKRLGVHQVLMDKLGYRYAASYSYGMKWYEINAICKEKGF